jgi:TRAP-type C4-dicarboxylate transport system permease large subunit
MMVLAIVLITVFPAIVTWLPEVLIRKPVGWL